MSSKTQQKHKKVRRTTPSAVGASQNIGAAGLYREAIREALDQSNSCGVCLCACRLELVRCGAINQVQGTRERHFQKLIFRTFKAKPRVELASSRGAPKARVQHSSSRVRQISSREPTPLTSSSSTCSLRFILCVRHVSVGDVADWYIDDLDDTQLVIGPSFE